MAPIPSTSKLTTSPMIELIKSGQLIKQGAEAKVYKTTLYPSPSISSSTSSTSNSTTSSSTPPQPIQILLKHRFPKTYRHKTLDSLLTKQRLTFEARTLIKCFKSGIKVPNLRGVDLNEGIICMEWIQGWSVREVLGGGQDDEGAFEEEDEEEKEEEEVEEVDVLGLFESWGIERDEILFKIGIEIGKMHLADIIHGDLTTSNMMIRLLFDPTSTTSTSTSSLENVPTSSPKFEVVMIDFGLTSTSILAEDRSVDLYVLERAFSSTHPVPILITGEEGKPLFEKVLEGYKECLILFGKKGDWNRVEIRLEEVRGRGRKRSMVG